MAGDLRRWWVHTLTDHLLFSLQANVFIAGNKHGAVRALSFKEGRGEEAATFLSWAVSCVPPWNTKAQMPPVVPRRQSLAVPQEVSCFPRSQDGPYL